MPGLNTIPLQRFHGLNPTLPGYGGPRRSENASFAALQQALMASLVSIVVLKRDAGSLSLRTCIVRSLFPAVSPYIKQPIALLRLWSVLPTFLSYAKGIPTGQCPKLACSNNQ